MGIVCASANPHKVAEMEAILAPLGLRLDPRPDWVPEVVEDADSLEGNARLKAEAIGRATAMMAIADDTGLEVDALGGAPGVRSARYAGDDSDDRANVEKLLAELVGVGALEPAQRRARFRTVIVARWPDGSEVVTEGVVHGTIATEPRGDGGFGYDPVFVADEYPDRTFAELDPQEKNAVSHRGRALRDLADRLRPSVSPPPSPPAPVPPSPMPPSPIPPPAMPPPAMPPPAVAFRPMPPPVGAPLAAPAVIRWGLGDVIIGIALWVLGSFAAVVALLVTGQLDLETDSGGGELSVIALMLSLAGGWIGFVGWPVVASWFKGQRSLVKDFGLSFKPIDLLWGVLGGIAALVASVTISVLWTLLNDESAPSNTEFLPDRPGVLTGLAVFVLVALLTPVAEELFFRGLMLRALGRRWNLTVGVIVSSVVFGLFHFQGDSLLDGLAIVIVTAAFGAVFAGLTVLVRGRLGPAIVAHVVVNATAVLVTFAG